MAVGIYGYAVASLVAWCLGARPDRRVVCGGGSGWDSPNPRCNIIIWSTLWRLRETAKTHSDTKISPDPSERWDPYDHYTERWDRY